MSNESINRELLAGYADGEISAFDRAVVEGWLRDHPELRAEVEAQRALGRKNALFCQQASVGLPSESAWQRTLIKVRSALEPARPLGYDTSAVMPRGQKARWQIPAAAAFTAAGLLLAIAFGPSNPSNDVASNGGQPFAVATAEEVEVVALQGDASLLVVGRPLLGDQLEMVTVGDVALDAIVGDADVTGPKTPQNPADLKKPVFIAPTEKTQPVP